MAFFPGLILIASLTAFADAGVLSLHTLDVGRDYYSPSPQSFRCNMRVTEPVVLIIDCPVESLFTGPTLLVMGIKGVVSGEALLMSTTLTCADVGDVKILNGRVCQTTTTQNQTTGGWPWPIPGVPEGDGEEDDEETTTTSELTTTSQTTVTAGSTETTTHFIAFTVAVHVNWTIVTVTLAVLMTSVGAFVAVRVCLRRRRRRSVDIQQPVQEPTVSSSTPFVPESPRRRRPLRPSSAESVELFAVTKLD